MARPQKFRHSREALNDPQIAEKLGRLVIDIEALREKRKQIDDQIAAGYDAVDDAGFEKKFVRKVIALRAKETDARRDEDDGIETYEFAVEKGVSLACARRERNLPPHDAVTGEIHEQPETAKTSPASRLPEVPGGDLSKPSSDDDGEDRSAQAGHRNVQSEQAAQEFQPPAFLKKDHPVKTARDYRTHCLNPDACAASGLTHCYSCSKAMADQSEAA